MYDKEFCPCGNILQKETTAKYDKVLLDAPCSGLGVLSKVPFFIKFSRISPFQRSVELTWIWNDKLLHYIFFIVPKRADLRWNRQFEDLEELICLQDELLDSASTWVMNSNFPIANPKQGIVVIYMGLYGPLYTWAQYTPTETSNIICLCSCKLSQSKIVR
jgi:hypothetical protein